MAIMAVIIRRPPCGATRLRRVVSSMLQQVMSLSAHQEDILAMSAISWFEQLFQFAAGWLLIRARVRGAKRAHSPLRTVLSQRLGAHFDS